MFVRTSRKAVFSLILSLLGLPFSLCIGLLGSIPAIVLGHWALSDIKRSGGALGGRNYAQLGLVLGYLVVVVNVPFLMVPPGAREPANSASCRNNLKLLSTCLWMYRSEHDGEYPRRIADLFPEYLTDPMVVICPSSGTEAAGDVATIDEWMDYKYSPASTGINDASKEMPRPITLHDGSEKPRVDTPDARTVVLQDKSPVHFPRGRNKTPGRNKAFADGHVEFVPEPGERKFWRFW